MKHPHVAELEEGPAAFERFRNAVKTLLHVRKSDIPDRPRPKVKRATKPKR
jgi:hypothetical protein